MVITVVIVMTDRIHTAPEIKRPTKVELIEASQVIHSL